MGTIYSDLFDTLPNEWTHELTTFFDGEMSSKIIDFLNKESLKGSTIFPQKKDIFKALDLTPFQRVKVVIIGQDPYHDEGQAEGLAFSVPKGMKIPPSLRSIFKELQDDLNIDIPYSGHLSSWASQGVLLLNTTLTVTAHQANSHKKSGWNLFTEHIISVIAQRKRNVVFILWGNQAQKYADHIDPTQHLIIRSAHPSPLSAYQGFFGSKPFSTTNNYLIKNKITPIDWSLDIQLFS